MYQVDLNSDLGESFGAYTIGLDQDVIAHVSSANIACGYHAGDPLVMDRTVAACKAAGVAVGWALDGGTWRALPRKSKRTFSIRWGPCWPSLPPTA